MMTQNGFPVVTALIVLPLVAAVALLFMRREWTVRTFTLGVGILECLLCLPLLGYAPNGPAFQFVEQAQWLPALGMTYHMGVDGLSLYMILLTALMLPLCVLGSWTYIAKRVTEFHFCLLLMTSACIGVFAALDFVLFYVFWELMLIPMVFIIGVWGGARRIYAAVKFFLFTLAGSVLMLVALLAVIFIHQAQTGVLTTDLLVLYNTSFEPGVQMWLFAAFALAFAIKVPMFPLHTWLPDAHVEAPTAGSVILAAVLLKMGTYGFMRFAFPLFPGAAVSATPVLAVLAVIGILYGAMVALVQVDIKKLIAYSSVSHLGYVMLGIVSLTPAGVSGGMLQMINHGISTGMLFLLVGVIYERRHTRLISEFGGLASRQPGYAVVFLLATLSSIGLPGTNGFVGEFLVMLGTFNSSWLATVFGKTAAPWVLAAFAGTGVILGAVYMLWMVQRVFFGPLANEKNRGLTDLCLREALMFVPLIMAVFGMGLFPTPFLLKIEPAVKAYIEDIQTRAAGQSLPKASAAAAASPGQATGDKFVKIYDKSGLNRGGL